MHLDETSETMLFIFKDLRIHWFAQEQNQPIFGLNEFKNNNSTTKE